MGVVTTILARYIGEKAKLLLRQKQQGFKPQTSMDQGGINAPPMGVELATIGRVSVALANRATYGQYLLVKNAKCLYIYGL